jgi:ELWxxDGT repeat protein
LLDGRSSIPGPFVAAGSSVVFVASDDTFGREPFAVSSDAGLVLLDDTLAGSSGSNASVFAGPGFAGILTAISGASRLTQGTPQTTSTLAGVDRYFGPSSGIIGDRLYLVPQGAPNGLWSVDVNGRVVGLPLVLAPLAGLTTAANGLFFTARSPVSGLELWFTDGSSVGTVELDLSPGLASSAPEQLTRYKQGVAFSALDGAGRELWWSNGTRDTTARLADLAPGPFSGRPQSMVALGDRLAFFADDGVHGLEPWLWDGTAAQQITELVPGDAGVVPLRSIALGRRAISVVSFPDGSQHLIRSDGTAAGTAELGPLSGNTWLQAVGGTLFFDNATPETGVELWAWWPTLAAPMRLTDSAPGPRSSMPGPGAAAGTLYVFAGLDLDGGREPWGVTVDVTPPVVTPQVTGPLGPNGVYTGDVTVHFALGDPESAVSSEGCADVTVSADTAGLTLHCVADSAGGTGEGSVTVRRDTTAPVLTCPPSAVFSQGALALEVSALDAQDPAPALVYQPALADVTPLTEQVHVVASDATGNSSSCEVVVQVPGAPPRKDPLTSCGCGGTGDAALEGALLVALLVLRRRRQSGVRVKT